MEAPFMRGYWNSPENMLPRGTRRSWHEKGSPRYGPSNARALPLDRRENPSKSGVSAPVEFADSSSASKPRFQMKKKKKKNYKWRAKMNRTVAAVKMQAAYRGFRVRKCKPLKNLKAIAQAKRSVEELKRQIGDKNFRGLIRQNEKERLIIAEKIMSLLLKLDAIQGVDTSLRESRKAVIRELIKLQETVDSIIVEETLESESLTKTAEQSILANRKSSPHLEPVAEEIHASESSAASSSNTDLTFLETDLAKKVILSEKDDEYNKIFPVVKEIVTSSEIKNPKDYSETLDDSSGPVKDSSEFFKHSLRPVKDFSEAGNFPSSGDLHDNVDVSIAEQERGSSDMPRVQANESAAMEEDFRSASRDAILQEAFEILDQIKSCSIEGQAQKYNASPMQANGAANFAQEHKEKLNKAITEHGIESSEELNKSEDIFNQSQLSQQDKIPAAKISVQVNDPIEATPARRREGTKRLKNCDNEFKSESTIITVEDAIEENDELKKIIEDLHQRNQILSDIFADICTKLEQLGHRMMHLNNQRESLWAKK